MKKAKKSTAARKKTAKPAAKKSAKASAKPSPKRASSTPAKSDVGTYTPQPIQGIGWAPFRYPLSS